jgi:hypothetical protein
VSRRSKRRQGPHRGGREGAAPTGQAGQAPEATSAASPGSSAEARRPGREGAAGRPRAGPTPRHAASGWGLGVQLAFLVAVFAVVVLVAELAGAANLGVALGVGQIAFAIAVVYLLVRR